MADGKHKPIIETLINTAAIALTAFGTNEIINGSYYGFITIAFAIGLELLKYVGRQKDLW
jgi:hypothetical protein